MKKNPTNMTKQNYSKSLVLVDDEEHILTSSSLSLQAAGMKNIQTFVDSREVLPHLALHPTAVILIDLLMPHISGMELLEVISKDFPETAVIMVTAVNDLEMAVQCIKKGAHDYLTKPVSRERLVSAVNKAMELSSMKSELALLKKSILIDELERPESFSSISTVNREMKSLFRYIEAISCSERAVLIEGETGTGKELFARAVHTSSGRTGEFIAVNLAGLDDDAFSDTLFGHIRGAFTGAEKTRAGFIEAASGGTLFLDEIADLAEKSQVKILRLLQEKTYHPLGSDMVKMSDARIVCAANKNFAKLVQEGKFRNDLYYRLRTHQILLPPLRERKEDIPLLVDRFLTEGAAEMDKKKPTPPPELFTLLNSYDFPGNIRELEAMVYDAISRHHSGKLSMDSFKSIILPHQSASVQTETHQNKQTLSGLTEGQMPTLKEAEQMLIREALRRAGDNQGIAASFLGITRQALNRRLLRQKKG